MTQSQTKWIPTQLVVLKEIIHYQPYYYLDEVSKAYHQRLPNDMKSNKSIWIALRKKVNRMQAIKVIGGICRV